MRNKLLKAKSNVGKRAYNLKRNCHLTLVRKTEKDYYNNSDRKKVTDNKTFWKSINPLNPLFSEKSLTHNKITLVEQDVVLDKNENVAEVLNNFFVNVASNLNIPKYHDKSLISIILRIQ